MAYSTVNADVYIAQNVIIIEDWMDCDEAKKTRLLNVANSTLGRTFPKYTIPEQAVYEFAAVLARAYNETNAQRQDGVKNFMVAGMSLTFTDGVETIESLIPAASIDLIGKANNVDLGGVNGKAKRIKWTVL